MILLLLLFQTTSIAFAAVQAAGADIPVVIEGGGTAYIIPEINSPLPREVTIRVGNGRTGHLYIDFTETGVFRYTIKAGFSRPDGELPADEVFQLTVTVYERDGSLYTVSVINGNHTSTKPDEVRFKEKTEPSEPASEPGTVPPHTDEPSTGGIGTTTAPQTRPNDSTVPSTRPHDTTVPTTRPHDTTVPMTRPYETTTVPTKQPPETPRVFRIFSAPKTGDESHLAYYLLIATASSAGLFGVALLYTMNTKKLIKKD